MSKWPRAWIDGKATEEPRKPLYRKVPKDKSFHLGQVYEKKPAAMLQCRKCGGTDFNVGVGSYFTAIRCVTCRWETCIHDG